MRCTPGRAAVALVGFEMLMPTLSIDCVMFRWLGRERCCCVVHFEKLEPNVSTGYGVPMLLLPW